MTPEGVKTEASDRAVAAGYMARHIGIGIEALKLVRRRGRSVKHFCVSKTISTPGTSRNEMAEGRQSASPAPSTTAGVTIERLRLRAYSPLRPAARITSPHLRVSSSMILPNSAAVPPFASSP